MTRFEQLVVADRRDEWGIPRRTATVVLNVDEICSIQEVTIDTTYRSFFDARCPRGIFPAVEIALRSGAQHTLLLGQFSDATDADFEIDRFSTWLSGCRLL